MKVVLNLISYSWEQRKLEELGKIETGNTPATSNLEYYSDTGFLWITPTDITSNITTKTVKYLSDKGEKVARVIPANSTLCTCIASIGKNTFCPIKCAFNQQINALSPNNSNDPYFIFTDSYHWSITMKKGAGGLTFQIVNKTEFSSIKTYIPSKQEQVKIGQLFYKLDSLITLHQRKLIFLKSHRFLMSVLFCYSWEQRKLSDLMIEYKETVDSYCTLPVLTSSKTEGVVLQEEHFGRVQNHDITGYNILPRNYCTYRNRSDGVDFTFNINRCCDKGIISKFYPVFYGNNSDIFFISMVLNYCNEVVREIAYTCTGTGQKVLSFLDLQKMNIRVPSYDEQKKISQYFEQFDNLITLHQRKQL